MKRTKVVFNAAALRKRLTDSYVNEQTRRLIEYAKEKIVELGNEIQTYASRNHMDRTGQLLNSLCWGVTYDGKLVDSGFYREEAIRMKSSSYLHEFFDNAELVQGRKLAQEYLKAYKPQGDGWNVFLAILAPYWGYWESGFTMIGFSRDESGEPKRKVLGHFQHAVLVHKYIEFLADLKPAKVTINVFVPKYSYKNKKYKNRVGYRKIGLDR